MAGASARSRPPFPLDLVVMPGEVVPLEDLPESYLGAGLEELIAQETQGRQEGHNSAVAATLTRLGFSWESLSELGHMRAVGPAAVMLREAEEQAIQRANGILAALDISGVDLAGVSLVDAANPRLRGYLSMIDGGEELYGSAYQVDSAGNPYVLRQTSCFQKYAYCLDHRLVAAAMPLALFEISESFRREPVESLQLCGRTRRFHLPEAHVHTGTVADAVEVSLGIHPHIMKLFAEMRAEVVLLVTCTHDFMMRFPNFAARLVDESGIRALVRIIGPGEQCMEGVDVDVEYKIVDSAGCCRELATFQIDQAITERFGVRADDLSVPATIHLVPSGSIERRIYMEVDAAGDRRPLPSWLAPIQVRVAPASPQWHEVAAELGRILSAAGLRADIDDRYLPAERTFADADSLLIPVTARVDGASADSPNLSARAYGSGRYEPVRLADLITELNTHRYDLRHDVPRLSRHPFGAFGTRQEAPVHGRP